jgi:flavodoxin
MSALIIYDSAYGNTAKVAQAIGAALPGGAAVHRITDIAPSSLPRVDLLIVGSPTQGGRPTAAMQEWLAAIPRERVDGVDVAAFDTRIAASEQGFALRLLIGVIGYASPRILKSLEAKGGVAAAAAEGFIVEGKEGPMARGELERAAAWALDIGVHERAAA